MSQLGEQLARALGAQPAAAEDPTDAADTRTQITRLVARVAGIDREEVDCDADFVTDLGLSRLQLLELALRVEQATGVQVGDEDAFTFATAADVIAAVDKQNKAQ
ncbi:Acyl carrier protein [Corynebacterium ciconiae DSM 44920]|uniref:acyl carrier protein n=1 Tax=Corynebacterium ciconiae TaxID=227319 RepID=UPI00036BD420|nr:acyl carrier protein [Corynebacterium ciconiae]WKD60693.1 Acyl carrier protein [Corynebacterium ciconiae DSM 44920]